MTEQELHVINSLKGKPADFVAQIMAIIPELIQAVEESGCRTPKEYHAARAMIEGNTPGFALGLVMATTKFNQE